jgi:hypothetical protein
MPPESTVQDETAKESDDSTADRIEGDYAGQQECEHHEGSAALMRSVSPCEHHLGDAGQKCNGEEHSAGLGEQETVTEPPPVASYARHA